MSLVACWINPKADILGVRSEAAGIKDNEILLFSKLMDSESLFLTANADTVYYLGFVDLSKGPMVVETPPDALGTFDDMWFRWVTDFGRPGPDRGEGGKYLLVGPGYEGYLPEDGFYVAHSKTNRVVILGRSFLTKDDPAPVDLSAQCPMSKMSARLAAQNAQRP